MQVDLFIAGDSGNDGPPVAFEPSVLERTAQIAGVQRVVGQYLDMAAVTLPDGTVENRSIAAMTNLRDTVELTALTVVSGRIDQLGPTEAVLDQRSAEQLHLSVGDTVTMRYSKGQPHQTTLAGIYQSTAFMDGFMTPTSVVGDFFSQQPVLALIQTTPDASVPAVKTAIDRLLADSPEVTVSTMDSLLDQVTASLRQVLTMVQILLGLAILIAALGIINTLALSIIERTRELGMLRAVGLRRSQLMRMVTAESIIMSLFGALLGLAVGSGLGIAVVKALKSDGITSLSLPWAQLATYLVLAALLGVVAAVIPAIRAARVNILDAIAHE